MQTHMDPFERGYPIAIPIVIHKSHKNIWIFHVLQSIPNDVHATQITK